MRHSQTPPHVPLLPTEEIRKVISMNPGLRTPQVDAWLKAQLDYDHWRIEEKKRLDFIKAIDGAIHWPDQELDKSALRSLYDRVVEAAINGDA